ncbi:MAG: Cof-type HAD-IIB family hydrolase [Sarcina ventriculi]|nr:Cof-type HAD-IIB family hydrolase [Sarcina ventriculi]MBU5322705.1 Cof-type HAD-IIB family hydrolase [Sarcina ventriculi]MCI5635472.1 Cof-type HAD-IIB family hydrolase [Sarcina ventriculi]MDD7374101.1 Cof-type HAD-IIB family hydrolase [Sarcina ventriculi]MDY7061990.1 Cof-type HAD-IIB family hydrolase [Sarcina ventriculi]
MEYKMICIDMDGTLLNSKHEVSERNKKAIKEAIKKGIVVAITTGRIFKSAKIYADLLGIETPIVASNGGFIKEQDKEEIIYKSALTYDQLKVIDSVIKKHNLNVYYNLYNGIILEKTLNENHAYKQTNRKAKRNEDKITILENVDVDKAFKENEGDILKAICIENENIDALNRAKKELREIEGLEVVSSWSNNFEVMPKGTCKWSGIKQLAKILGIKENEIICIGDSENDLSMIQNAGFGIAMGNARKDVKEAAKYITDNNECDGVGKAIEKIVLGI